MMNFDPNRPDHVQKQKRPEWATFVPDRRPRFKTYTNRGHALNAAHYTRDYVLYQWNAETDEWDEIYRHEGLNPNNSFGWRKLPNGKIAEPLQFGKVR